jgi:hypothetical protein
MPAKTEHPAPGYQAEPLGDVYDPVSNPYGPHPNGVDAAAGGADSSPFENEPTGNREDVAAAERYLNRTPENDLAGEPSQTALD